VRTVVLGGTGFIGSHLVDSLAARGEEVVAVSRRGTWAWGEPPRNTRVVALDVADQKRHDELAALLEDADRVVNLVGILNRPTLTKEKLHYLHVDGTRHIVVTLAKGRVERSRLVHVSTTGVLGPTGKTPKDEEAPPNPTNDYETTKLEGETIALASRRPSREVAIVRPGLVYGPRDRHLLGWFKAISAGAYRAIGGGRALWQPVYVGDVVRGIEAALDTRGADGQTFHLAGKERITIADLGTRIGAALGKHPHRTSFPYPLAMAAGTILEAIYLPWKKDPPLSRARVRTMTQDRVYAIDRAERLLKVTPETTLDEGLRKTVAWYRAHGQLG
jgi:nucleoside-diphosphate-sugar epimerase